LGQGPAVVTGPPLVIEVVVNGGTVTLVISGELDLATTPILTQCLAQLVADSPQRLVFDMAKVDFIDCAAIQLITSTGRFLPENRRPVIRRPSRVVRRMLALTGLTAQCEVDDGDEPPASGSRT
jgi:anti-sigma B factor antagonist